MQEKTEKVLEMLERMREEAKKLVDDRIKFYACHADCALEFAEMAIELIAEIEHNLPTFGQGFVSRFKLYTEKRAQMLFNEGWFNSIAIGYGKLALERMGLSSRLREFEIEIGNALDLNSADVAHKIYQRIEKGETV